MIRAVFVAFAACALIGAASPSPAPTVTPSIQLAQTRLDTMLRTGHADPSWFSDGFLDQIPASKVDAVLASLVSQYGAYQSIELKPDAFVAQFAKGTLDVLIHMDANAKIDYLLFRPPAAPSASP
jgi:hypothetical protein